MFRTSMMFGSKFITLQATLPDDDDDLHYDNGWCAYNIPMEGDGDDDDDDDDGDYAPAASMEGDGDDDDDDDDYDYAPAA
jgi:hypothetical protein